MDTRYYYHPNLGKIPVSDSGFQLDWVVDKLLQFHPTFGVNLGDGKIEKVNARDITDGQGHVAVIYRVVFSIVGGKKPTFSFVMKVLRERRLVELIELTAGEIKKKEKPANQLPMTAVAHNAECDFYERMKDIDVIPMPKVWYTHKVTLKSTLPGLILMEDLSDVARCGRYESGVSMEQIKNVVRHLARFHAYQMAGNSAKFAGLKSIDPVSDGYEKMFLRFLEPLVEMDPKRLGPLVERFRPLSTTKFAEHALLKRHGELGLPTLFCHGDLWSSNLMLAKGADGAETNRVHAFIDWQVFFHGNALYDIARYVICADAEVRRKAEKFIVQFYHDEVLKCLKEFKHPAPQNFTVKILTEAYKLAFIRATLTVAIDPPFLANVKRAAGMKENLVEADVAKLLLRTRFALEDALKKAEDVAPQFMSP